jgi:hypothetical protein
LNCIDFSEALGGTGVIGPEGSLADLANSKAVYTSFKGSASTEACGVGNEFLDGACDDESGELAGRACNLDSANTEMSMHEVYVSSKLGEPPVGTICRTDEDSGQPAGCVNDVPGAEECRYGFDEDCTNQCKKAEGTCSKFYSSVDLKTTLKS